MGKVYQKSLHSIFCGRARKEKEIPKYHCSSCTKCIKSYCQYFNRHVIPSFNKCFFHSQYTPITGLFKVTDNLEEIIEKEQEKIGQVA